MNRAHSDTVTDNEALASASNSAIAAAVARLAEASASGVPRPPVRDLIGRDDLAAAYAVQAALTERRLAAGARTTGRKIGLTSEAVQRQLGVDQPDFGVLFDDMAHTDGATVPAGSVLQPRVEAEVAFVLRAGLADGPLDTEQVRDAVGYGVAALEICGSRIADWDISLADTVADNASAGAYVLGTDRRTLAETEPADVVMSMNVNGTEVSTGTGAACLGDPLAAVAWLARTARAFGEPLRAGDVVLSGALGPMHPVSPGDTVTATLSGFGSVTVRFGTGEAA